MTAGWSLEDWKAHVEKAVSAYFADRGNEKVIQDIEWSMRRPSPREYWVSVDSHAPGERRRIQAESGLALIEVVEREVKRLKEEGTLPPGVHHLVLFDNPYKLSGTYGAAQFEIPKPVEEKENGK